MNIRFSFASVYLSSSYFSVFNSSTTNPNQLHTSSVSSDGFWIINFEGKKLHLKSWFPAKNFWPAELSSEESKEPLTYDEVTSWRSDVLKLYCRQQGLKVSGSKQELFARVFDFTPGIVYFHYRMSTSCIRVTALIIIIITLYKCLMYLALLR